jgi:hypothetical protein
MESTKDISIGENNWIKWVDFDPMDDNSILEIDNLLKPTFDFWDGLETQCLAECCGIDAFAFWEEDIMRSSKELDHTQLVVDLRNVKAELIKSSKTIVLSSKLNNLLDKAVFVKLVDHILTTIETNKTK